MSFARVDIPSQGRQLATYRQEGQAKLGAFIVAGHRSVFTGNGKWEAIAPMAADMGIPVTGFDYAGYGNSEGEPEQTWQLESWLRNALDAFDAIADRPQIVIGNSMGGWLSLALALLRPDKIASLFLLAPGFGSYIQKTGRTSFDLPEGKGNIAMQLAEDGRHQLVGKYGVSCPVMCLHGMDDDTVSYKCSLDLIGAIDSQFASANILKHFSHRGHGDEELALFVSALKDFIPFVNKHTA